MIRSVLRNIASNYLGTFLLLGIALFLTPFILHRLGASGYGIWVLINNIKLYFGFFELGICAAVVKLVSEDSAKKMTRSLNELMATSLITIALLGILAYGVVILVAYTGVSLFEIPAEYTQTIRTMILIVGIAIALGLLSQVVSSYLMGFQRFDLTNLSLVISGGVIAVSTVLLLRAGYGLISLAVLMAATTLLELLLKLFLLSRIFPLRLSKAFFAMSALKRIWGYGIYAFLLDVTSIISRNVHALIIGYSMPISSLAGYNISVRLASIVERAYWPLADVFIPLASEIDALKSRENLRKLMLEGTKFSLLLVVPFSLVLFFSGKTIISLWVGEEYSSYASILYVLLLVSLVETLQSTSSDILRGTGHLRYKAIVGIGLAITVIALSAVLMQYHGLLGVALGVLSANIVFQIFFLLPYTCKLISLPLRELMIVAVLPPLIPVVPTLLAVWLAKHYLVLSGMGEVILLTVIILVIFSALYSRFAISRDYWIRYREHLSLLKSRKEATDSGSQDLPPV